MRVEGNMEGDYEKEWVGNNIELLGTFLIN